MKYLLIAMLLFGACGSAKEKDTPEKAAKKQACKQLLSHIFEISPESKGQPADPLVAKMPIEDIEQCAAAEPEIIECMQKAADVAAVKACINDEVIACLGKAKDRAAVRKACVTDPKAADHAPPAGKT